MFMACNSTDPMSVLIGQDIVELTDQLKYLGSVYHASGDINSARTNLSTWDLYLLHASSDINCDVRALISAAWDKPWVLVASFVTL